MPGVRDHEPVVIEQFEGWWKHGDPESAPSNHFTVADNVQYFHSGVETRDPLDKYQTTAVPLSKVMHIVNYTMQTGQSLLVLVEGGKIYHVVGPNTVYGPILTIPAMEDFGFVAYGGRAYITPFKTYVNPQGTNYELGLQNEFVYVYKGDGTQARKAGGVAPVGTVMVAANGVAGKTDTGLHLIAVLYETDTGFTTALGPAVFTQKTFTGVNKINMSNIPVSPNSYVKKRHLVSTKWISSFNGDQAGYQFFFIPGGNIDDNTSTTKTIEYFDSDLVGDASHFIDNFSEIPAGVNLSIYHSRMVIVGEYGTPETLTGLPAGITDNRSLARLSFPGEPESISKVTGLIIAPLDGNPLTNVQEIRDILYLFKKSRIYAYSDNFDVPSSWQEEALDQAGGTSVHGVVTILDSGGITADFLLIADQSGLILFNGTLARPELTWKIEDFWVGLDRNAFRYIKITADPISKRLWITLPPPYRHILLHGDFGNGMDAEKVRWARWIFDVEMSSICLLNTDKVILGAFVNVE